MKGIDAVVKKKIAYPSIDKPFRVCNCLAAKKQSPRA
jgi:hypothetical protein